MNKFKQLHNCTDAETCDSIWWAADQLGYWEVDVDEGTGVAYTICTRNNRGEYVGSLMFPA